MSGRSADEVIDFRVSDPVLMAQRAEALQTAERALAQGDTDAAIAAFDRAAMMLHAADTEMGLVRAHLQAGEYRRALAFCAHTAGAHRDAPAAAALYAWLLRAGGQDGYAHRVLAEALARAPRDAVLALAMRSFESASGTATGVLLSVPHRMAPHALDAPEAMAAHASARVVSSGVLFDAGRRALVPTSPVETAARLWVRNGRGITRSADVETGHLALAALGLTVLRLSVPMTGIDAQLPPTAPRDPFAGSPGFAMGYDRSDDPTPAWPRLHQGFFGSVGGRGERDGVRKLGIDVPHGPQGGPLLDAQGRLAGIVIPGADGRGVMLPVSSLAALLPSAQTQAGSPEGTSPTLPMSADAAYEWGLRVALQVIAQP